MIGILALGHFSAKLLLCLSAHQDNFVNLFVFPSIIIVVENLLWLASMVSQVTASASLVITEGLIDWSSGQDLMSWLFSWNDVDFQVYK